MKPIRIASVCFVIGFDRFLRPQGWFQRTGGGSEGKEYRRTRKRICPPGQTQSRTDPAKQKSKKPKSG